MSELVKNTGRKERRGEERASDRSKERKENKHRNLTSIKFCGSHSVVEPRCLGCS